MVRMRRLQFKPRPLRRKHSGHVYQPRTIAGRTGRLLGAKEGESRNAAGGGGRHDGFLVAGRSFFRRRGRRGLALDDDGCSSVLGIVRPSVPARGGAPLSPGHHGKHQHEDCKNEQDKGEPKHFILGWLMMIDLRTSQRQSREQQDFARRHLP